MRLVVAAVAILATLSGAVAQTRPDAPPPIVIDDDGTIRMHGDVLVVSPDGTVSMGNFEFRRGGDAALSVGHRESDHRLTIERNGRIHIGKGFGHGLTLWDDGAVQVGFGKGGFFAWPGGSAGLRATDGGRAFWLKPGGEMVFGEPMVTGTVVVTGTVARTTPRNIFERTESCNATGSGGCSDTKAPTCKHGSPAPLATVKDEYDGTDVEQFVCYGP